MSEEDRTGKEIFKSSIKVVDGHFEIGLMCAEEHPLAFKHWKIHERTCEKDPELGKAVNGVIQDSIKRNFCRLMSADEEKRSTNKTDYVCYFAFKKMTLNKIAGFLRRGR